MANTLLILGCVLAHNCESEAKLTVLPNLEGAHTLSPSIHKLQQRDSDVYPTFTYSLVPRHSRKPGYEDSYMILHDRVETINLITKPQK